MSGEDHMPDHGPLPQHSAGVEFTFSGNGYHLPDRLRSYVKVIRRVGILRGERRVIILEIRQKNVHGPHEHPHRLRPLVGSRIVDDRDYEPHTPCIFHSGDDLRHIVRRRHQIDIIRLLLLQLKKNLC